MRIQYSLYIIIFYKFIILFVINCIKGVNCKNNDKIFYNIAGFIAIIVLIYSLNNRISITAKVGILIYSSVISFINNIIYLQETCHDNSDIYIIIDICLSGIFCIGIFISNINTIIEYNNNNNEEELLSNEFQQSYNSVVVIDNSELNISNIEDTCSICLEPLNNINTNIVKLNECNHNFHKECIETWITTTIVNPVCPICRITII